MKTIREIDKERIENQKIDAHELIQRMLSFIPLSKKFPTSSLISAKYCAKVACDYLCDNLPNINETPPNSREEEKTYWQYWSGVRREIVKFKAEEQPKKD